MRTFDVTSKWGLAWDDCKPLSHSSGVVNGSISQTWDHISHEPCYFWAWRNCLCSPLLHLNWKNNTFFSLCYEGRLFFSSVLFQTFAWVCYLNGPVQRGTGKLVIVFGVDHNLHDVVSVPLKHLTARPLSVPVPQLDQHVIWKHIEGLWWVCFTVLFTIKKAESIRSNQVRHNVFDGESECTWFLLTTAGEDVGLRRVDGDKADVVSVSLKHVNLLQRVVVEHTDQHIILGMDRGNDKGPKRSTETYLSRFEWDC